MKTYKQLKYAEGQTELTSKLSRKESNRKENFIQLFIHLEKINGNIQ